MEIGSRKAFALVLLVGVAGTGLLTGLLNEVGYSTLGSVVWFTGYATTILVLWWGWLRTMDISGQTSPPRETDEDGEDGPDPDDGTEAAGG
jgi:hypothetical protein